MKEGNKVKIGKILADLEPHSTFEICETIAGYNPLNGGGSLLAIAARVQNLREMGCTIARARKDSKIKGMFWYQCTYMPQEAKEKLGLIPLPIVPVKEERGNFLFDPSWM